MRIALLALGLLAPAAATAQDTAIVIHPESAGVHLAPPELPRLVAEEVIRLYNAPTTTRLIGRTRLPRGNEWRGDVAVRNGPVLVGGRIQGSLLVINGEAVLEAGAEITGNLLIVGGSAARAAGATVTGETREYHEPLTYRLTGDSLTYAPDLRRRFRNIEGQIAFGTADTRSALTLATGGTFNRVEGVPVIFGPVFDWRLQGSTRARLDALGVFRTAGDLTHTRGDLGYLVRGELRTGESRPMALRFRAFDLIAPVEDWGLHSAEVGWAAFLFQRDYRDYYVSKGVAGSVTLQVEAPLSLSVELRRERETSVQAQDPWTVFRNDHAWRPNPPVDDGHYTTLAAGVALDTRNDRDNPTSGWYLRGTMERSASRDVAPQAGVPASMRDPIPIDGSYHTWRAWLDLRRYTRVSSAGRLNLRLLTGGWAGGDPLPLQRRVSLGGPDPLPGYAFRQGACNAAIVDPAFAGSLVAACDRMMLAQVEYRGHISLHWTYNPSREEGEGRPLESLIRLEGPDLVVYGDAGQAWLVGNGPGRVPSDKLPPLSSWLADVGLGVDWGGFGLYAAKAVTMGEPIRFVLRLDHRF
jgi:surface antigen Omp85-like protein